jgi:hypothetical protein
MVRPAAHYGGISVALTIVLPKADQANLIDGWFAEAEFIAEAWR